MWHRQIQQQDSLGIELRIEMPSYQPNACFLIPETAQKVHVLLLSLHSRACHSPVVSQSGELGVRLQTGGKTALPQRLRHFAIARDARPKGVWEMIESNMEVFNVKKMPSMLVPIAAMSKAEQADQRVVRLLQRAMKYLEGGGEIVPVVGAKAAAAVVKATHQLGTKEAKRLHLAWLGAMSAQVTDLSVPVVAELAQELLRYRVSDRELWRALVETTLRRSDEMGPAEIVYLMDAFRRSMAFGTDVGRAVQALCQRTLDCCQVTCMSSKDRSKEHLVRELKEIKVQLTELLERVSDLEASLSVPSEALAGEGSWELIGAEAEVGPKLNLSLRHHGVENGPPRPTKEILGFARSRLVSSAVSVDHRVHRSLAAGHWAWTALATATLYTCTLQKDLSEAFRVSTGLFYEDLV
eukprot:s523_g22.t1